MTKVPFDWSLVSNDKVCIHFESKDDLESFMSNLPDSAFAGIRTREFMKQQYKCGLDSFRFHYGRYDGEGYVDTYLSDMGRVWPGYVFADYESRPVAFVEVGDLL